MPGDVGSPLGEETDLDILMDESSSEDNESSDKDNKEQEEQEILEELDKDDEEDESEDSDEEEDKDGDEGDESEDQEDDNEKLGDYPDRPTYAQLKKYDPDFFKKFPGMRSLVYREREFSELWPSLEDAKAAVEELTNYRAVEQNITSGNPVEFMSLLEEYDGAVANKFADTFLPALFKTRPEVFDRITKPFLKHKLQTLYKKYEDATEGRSLNRKNAILHIHEELFGDAEVTKNLPAPQKQEPPKDEKYERERDAFYAQKASDFQQATDSAARTELDAMLLKMIDPNKALSDYDRRHILKDVREELDGALVADKQHMNLIGSLWQRAKKSGWSPEYKERIKTAYLSRARTKAPGIVQKARSEALKARRGKNTPIRTHSERSTPSPSARPNGRVKDDDIDWSKSSDLDILNDTPKRRSK